MRCPPRGSGSEGTPRSISAGGSSSTTQRLRTSSAAPVRGRAAAARSNGGRAGSSLPPSQQIGTSATRSSSSYSSPAPKRTTSEVAMGSSNQTPLLNRNSLLQSPLATSPAKRQAQNDLTQKLRAMDLALERIEREDASHCEKENFDIFMDTGRAPSSPSITARTPLGMPSRPLASPTPQKQQRIASNVAQNVATAGVACEVNSEVEPAIDISARRSSSVLDTQVAPITSVAYIEHTTTQREACAGSAALDAAGLLVFEDTWREAHATLRAEVNQQLASFGERLRDGDDDRQRGAVRLLTDFEVELTSALEVRAKEADGLLEQRLIEASEGLQRQLADLETSVNENKERLTGFLEGAIKELESAARSESARVAETSQSCGEALQQLTALRQRIQILHDDNTESKENFATLGNRMKQLQDDRDDTRQQLANLRQRFQQLQDDCDRGGMMDEMERRLKRLDDSLSARLQEAESAFTSGLGSQQSKFDIQGKELQRRFEDLQLQLLANVGELKVQRESSAQRESQLVADAQGAAKVRAEERFEELRHLCDLELSAIRGRVEAAELRIVEESDALRRKLEAVELRSASATDASVATQLQAFRIEIDRTQQQERAKMERLDEKCAQDARDIAIGEVDRQLARVDEERRLLGGHIDGIRDRQQRQQNLIEDLLAAAAKRQPNEASCGRVVDEQQRQQQQQAESFNGRLDALGARVVALEEGHAALEKTAVTATATDEVAEALRAWPRRLECLSSRLDGGRIQIRSEVRACEEAASKQAAQLNEIVTAQGTQLQDLSSRAQANEALSTKHASQLLELSQLFTNHSQDIVARADKADMATSPAAGLADVASQQSEQLEELSLRVRHAETECRAFATEAAKEAERNCATAQAFESAAASAVDAEKTASEAMRQAQNLRQLMERAEGAFVRRPTAETAAAFGQGLAGRALAEEDGRKALVRLEARVELAEARQRISFQDVTARLDELSKRQMPVHAPSGSLDSEPLWKPALRDLERDMKALLAAQVEDSAAALRTVATIVEDRSWLLPSESSERPWPQSDRMCSTIGCGVPIHGHRAPTSPLTPNQSHTRGNSVLWR